MEKRISLIIVFLLLSAILTAQSTVLSNTLHELRFQVWYSIEAIPGSTDTTTQNKEFAGPQYSIQNIQKFLPFILEGQLYGWNFSYTPYDKTRNVQEYFELVPVQEVSIHDPKILYDSPEISETQSSFSCWITYECSPYQIELLENRQTVTFKKISGKGASTIKNGTTGITDSFTEAAKNAIRTYYQKIIKNKPKEIAGRLYLVEKPRYYVQSGKYVADLDFLLEKGTITQYVTF